ncbi:MAG: sugar ABC transporter substrate-binding protein, partial [Clostridia bacterium]|nr:sugar ABC transporter substrate-binding protein [Clostridia bacterium]
MKKIVSLTLAVLMLLSLASFASADQDHFTIVSGISALSAGYDNNPVINAMAEKAGITIDWDCMSDSLSEQVNIRIAGWNLPDAFNAVGFN